MQSAFVRRFKVVAWLEGLSFVLLLGVAMPLKYLADMPMAVRVAGLTHGVLFTAYIVLIGVFVLRRGWSFNSGLTAFGLGILPLGTFFLGRALKRELSSDASRSDASRTDGPGQG